MQKSIINGIMALGEIDTRMKRQSQNINNEGIDISRAYNAYVSYFFEGGDLNTSAQEIAAGIRDVITTGKLKAANVETLTSTVAEMVGDAELAQAYTMGDISVSSNLNGNGDTLNVDDSEIYGYNGKEKNENVSYERPSHFRKGMRKKTWDLAVTESDDGIVRSPGMKVINEDDNWQMGHKPGYEFRKHKDSAEKRGISRREFLNEYNNPSHYRPELPEDNLSHRFEGPDELNYWDLF